MNDLAPIILFVYNRPWHTQQTLDALAKNELANESILYIYADGAKESATEQDLQKINEVRGVISNFEGCKETHIIEREKNWGLADNIIDGVTKIVNQYGKIIVLEDDIVTSIGFLKYMNDALDLYQNEERVMHIGAYVPLISGYEKLPETYFLRYMSCWGWGTWVSSWKKLVQDIDYLHEVLPQRKDFKAYNLEGAFEAFQQIEDNLSGKLKTWAVKWYSTIFLEEGLCLYPQSSLVSQIGFDGTGEHCGYDDKGKFNVNLSKKNVRVYKKNIKESKVAKLYYKRFFKQETDSFKYKLNSKNWIHMPIKIIKKTLKWILEKNGYRVISKEYSPPTPENCDLIRMKYQELIETTITKYEDFIFLDVIAEKNEKRLELMSHLLGTSIGEAIYIVKYLNDILEIDGDVCEFGVAQGRTSVLIAQEINHTSKKLWLFDSFEGLPKPTGKDVLKDDIFNLGNMEAYEGTMAYDVNFVKSSLGSIDFSTERLKIVHGFIEKTIKLPNLPNKVAFAYVDFDFYEPILLALNFLNETLSSRGVVIVDDYDFFSTGAKTAVDEFLSENKDLYEFILPYKSSGHFCILIKK